MIFIAEWVTNAMLYFVRKDKTQSNQVLLRYAKTGKSRVTPKIRNDGEVGAKGYSTSK